VSDNKSFCRGFTDRTPAQLQAKDRCSYACTCAWPTELQMARTYKRDALRDGTHLHNNHTDQDKADATVAEIRGVLYTACAQRLLLYTFTSRTAQQ